VCSVCMSMFVSVCACCESTELPVCLHGAAGGVPAHLQTRLHQVRVFKCVRVCAWSGETNCLTSVGWIASEGWITSLE
jgi:hypothetical protein